MIRVPLSRRTGIYTSHISACNAAKTTKRPLWRKTANEILVLADEPHESFDSKPYDPSPKTGMTVMMSVLFEVAKDSVIDGKSKRCDAVLTEQLKCIQEGGYVPSWGELGFEMGIEWIKARQENSGFRLIDTKLSQYERMEFIRKGSVIKIGTINFMGMVEITDEEKFKNIMINGLGHSKAWGCGLVLAQRA